MIIVYSPGVLKFVIISLLLFNFYKTTEAQCISGNCHKGYGVYKYKSGDRYEGEFINGYKEGYGSMYYINGDLFQGEWKKDMKDGFGKFFHANGDWYEGYYALGKKHGTGNYYWSSGGCRIGEQHLNGEYVPGSGKYENTLNEKIPDLKLDQKKAIIKIYRNESGTYEIPVIINDVLKIFFIMDTGASEVFITPDVALTLIRTGTISDNDWLPGSYFQFADGTVAKSYRFNVKTLQIGDEVIRNVPAAIANSLEAPMLLGQNVLSRLGKIQIDYSKHTLTIIK